MTGFRVALGGAQARYGITPDLTTFGKIIGGGMPVGAYGGRARPDAQIAPSGPIYQAGTLSGNPLAMAAGLATLDLIQAPGFHDALEANTHRCATAWKRRRATPALPFTTNRVGAMFGLFFTDEKVETYADADGLRSRRRSTASSTPCSSWRVPGAVGLRGRLHVVGARRDRDRAYA